MINDYQCCFDINLDTYEVEIKFSGDGQVIHFKFMIAYYSIPTFFYRLLRLWSGKTNKDELDGFGFAVRYNFTLEETNLLIEHLTGDDNCKYSTYNYKFDFDKFVQAIDRGFSDCLQEHYSKGILPLDEDPHPLSKQVIKEYEEFSTIINGKKGK